MGSSGRGVSLTLSSPFSATADADLAARIAGVRMGVPTVFPTIHFARALSPFFAAARRCAADGGGGSVVTYSSLTFLYT